LAGRDRLSHNETVEDFQSDVKQLGKHRVFATQWVETFGAAQRWVSAAAAAYSRVLKAAGTVGEIRI
jgi:hypothetical protein